MSNFSDEYITNTVTAPESGQKLQKYIQSKVGLDYSLKQIKSALENNLCKVNGRIERFASYQVMVGDLIQICKRILSVKPTSFAISNEAILYEDQSLLVYNKPQGITSEEDGLFSILKKRYPTLEKVHRLDKETSGAILFAKSVSIRNMLIECFRKKKVIKNYLAIIDGHLKEKSGSVDLPIGKISADKEQSRWGIVSEKKGGKPALTHWKKVCSLNSCSLVYCFPVTGRTHQIRIHLHSLGHPILGDKLYGKKCLSSYPAARHFLHAFELTFPNFLTQKLETVKAPLPADMEHAIKVIFKTCPELGC